MWLVGVVGRCGCGCVGVTVGVIVGVGYLHSFPVQKKSTMACRDV